MVAIPDAIAVLFPSAISMTDYLCTATEITRWNPTLGTQPTQAELDAVTQAQVDAAKLIKLRDAAKAFHTDLQAQNIALRITVKLVVDELNILRQWITDYKAAVAAAASLAALKTSTAALPNVPQRTYLQAKTAIETLIDGEG